MKFLIRAVLIIVLCCTLFNGKSVAQIAIIKVDFSDSQGYVSDSLYFNFSDYQFIFGSTSRYLDDAKTQVVASKNKIATYIETIKTPGFISIVHCVQTANVKNDTPIGSYYIEPGDDVTIVHSNDLTKSENTASLRFLFYGKGSEKFTCKMKIDSIIYHTINMDLASTEARVQQILDIYKNQVSHQAFEQLSIYAYSTITGFKIKSLLLRSKKSMMGRDFAKQELDKIVKADSALTIGFKTDAKYFSPEFCRIDLLKRSALAKITNGDRGATYNLIYEGIKTEQNAIYRDKLIGAFFFLHKSDIKPKIDSFAVDAVKIIKNEKVRSYVQRFVNLAVGKPFYKFVLPDVYEKKNSLEQLKGKVVFIDFWFTGCTACARYYQNVLTKAEHYFKNDPSVVFITINTDRDFQRWKTSLKSGEYTSDAVVNLYTEGLAYDHPLMKFLGITTAPTPILLDKNLNILDISNKLKNYDYLIGRIEEAKNVSK